MIPCVVMRGGTTRGYFFQTRDLPGDSRTRDEILFSIVAGSDSWRADGVGGNDLLLSKVALVSKSNRAGIDIDVIFGAITPGSTRIKYGSNCGNLISAAALYALDEKLTSQPNGLVRMFNPDSGGVVEARVMNQPSCASGMPQTGTPMEIAFIAPDGTIGRGLLPTGNVIDRLTLDDGRTVDVSIVDSGTVYVFVSMADIGEREDLLDVGENLRSQAAIIIGLSKTMEEARLVSPNVPKVAFVSPPGNPLTEDLVARIVSSQSLHNAYAVTGAFATIAAAVIPGSTVDRVLGQTRTTSPFSLRIRHPGGVIEPRVDVHRTAKGVEVERAYIVRTARRLMSGTVPCPVYCCSGAL
jgi:2-methylaconitate cis-trans-isomerase PrpF